MANWYVRPNTGHSGSRDGVSYSTAWGGWSEVVWGASGVNAGDTLYVCGRHEYSSGISVGAHTGGSGTETTISGEYTIDPGSLIFSSGAFLTNARSYTNIVGLTLQGGTSVCIYQLSGTITGNSYLRNTFIGGNGTCLSLDGTTTHTNTNISYNSFTNILYNSTGGSAVNWFVGSAGNAQITNLILSHNSFFSCRGTGTHRSVVHFRIQSDSNVASKMTNITVNNNTWKNCTGVACEFGSGFLTYGQSEGLWITQNRIESNGESPNQIGGGFSLWGFKNTLSQEPNKIVDNILKDIVGPAGGFNVFYGTYLIYDNLFENLTTSTIDGNGILFDYGTQNSKAYRNTFINILGKNVAVNSGVAIMVLDSTGVQVYSNYINSCKIGVFVGDKAGGQSCTIQNNTFLGCTHYGVYMLSTADQTTCTIRNNIFTGTGNSVTNLGSAWSLENYNCFYSLSTPSGHTFGANTITTNPNIRYGAPTSTTATGTTIGFLTDWEKTSFSIIPTMGALQYRASRGVR